MQVKSGSTLDFQMDRQERVMVLQKRTAEQQGAQALQLIESSSAPPRQQLAAPKSHLGQRLDIRV